jgi:hypothetical protein
MTGSARDSQCVQAEPARYDSQCVLRKIQILGVFFSYLSPFRRGTAHPYRLSSLMIEDFDRFLRVAEVCEARNASPPF